MATDSGELASLVHLNTLSCILKGCVVCSYKLVHSSGEKGGKRYGAKGNQRPESCFREAERKEEEGNRDGGRKGRKQKGKLGKGGRGGGRRKRRRVEVVRGGEGHEDWSSSSSSSEEVVVAEEEGGGNLAAVVASADLDGLGPYRRHHRILTVGDGDLSFSRALATVLRPQRLVATTYEAADRLEGIYTDFKDTVTTLREAGCEVLHGIDAATLLLSEDDHHGGFDRIVWNFPCVAVKDDKDEEPYDSGRVAGQQNLDGQTTELKENRQLLRSFFEASKTKLCEKGGEVHVTHKTKEPFSWWNIRQLAREAGFTTRATLCFDRTLFPGYVNRKALVREGFNAVDAFTYVFVRPSPLHRSVAADKDSAATRWRQTPSSLQATSELSTLEAVVMSFFDMPSAGKPPLPSSSPLSLYFPVTPPLIADVRRRLLRESHITDTTTKPNTVKIVRRNTKTGSNLFALLQQDDDDDANDANDDDDDSDQNNET